MELMMMVGLVLVCSRVLPENTFMQCFPDSVHICPRTFLDGDSTCGSFRFHHKEGYRGHCKELKSGPLRSNLVRFARAAYVTFCKLESEYPLTVLATPPLQKSMTWICHQPMARRPPHVTEKRDWPKRPKNVCAAFQHTQQKVIRRKYSGTLFQDALDGGGRVHSRSAPLKPCSQDLKIMNAFQSRISCRNEFCL